jgi:hypothetical protein
LNPTGVGFSPHRRTRSNLIMDVGLREGGGRTSGLPPNDHCRQRICAAVWEEATSGWRHRSPLLRVEAQATTVVQEEDGLGPSTAYKEAEPVSHIVMPLNTGVSTDRWARATLRGLTAALARRLPVLACSVRRREEKHGRVRNELGFASLRVSPDFIHLRIAPGRRIETNGCHRSGHGAAQVGVNLFWPRPTMRPGARGALLREWAMGPILTLGCAMREWAVGP